jgi:zinc D-Ala-D-Ala carboxypeptidase
MKDQQLSKNFSLAELCHTNSGLPNEPTSDNIINLSKLVFNVLQPIRDKLGFEIKVNSGYRSKTVNDHEGGVSTSQHLTGQAADLDCKDNALLFNTIKDTLIFDQLIWEKGNDKQPAWVHVSYREGHNRKQVIHIK